MKRKIAAIMAADVAGYSKLVAEDEEETLRRLASYRAVFDDFIARASGRIFNTAGDAILAEFPSAVDAVRCAIDVQESLRTRNLAYPPSRHMNFRIGMTIGDVVERNGDLLGDGVNVAARLQILAAPGGLCVSSIIYEQVVNKLSVTFADIGEQQVKNIPSPIHAYRMVMTSNDAASATLRKHSPRRAIAWWSIAIAAAFIGGALLFVVPAWIGGIISSVGWRSSRIEQKPETLVPEEVPFISDSDRTTLRNAYLPAQEHKALAVSTIRIGIATSQKDDETAKTAALVSCQKATDAVGPPALSQRCALYAVGDAVVYAGARPPLPPEPWVFQNPMIERPFAASDVPLVNDASRAILAKWYGVSGVYAKALAVSALGPNFFYRRQGSPEEAERRALQACGSYAGVPCMIIAVNDSFVVPITTTMKITGFFHARDDSALAPDAREVVAHRIGNALEGWSAVAAGSAGRAGVSTKATSEQVAIDAAMAECSGQDRNCRIVAVGPFSVGPRN
jgi:class 3 adenylate cyclase